MKITGLIVLCLVFLFMRFVSPKKDKYGRYTAEAYATAIGLMTATITGMILLAL